MLLPATLSGPRGRGRGLTLACALCLLLALALAPRAGAAGYGAISGSVTAASSHAAIEGISVCVTSTEFELAGEGEEEHAFGCADTEADGDYTISELRPGRYTVQFSSPVEGELDYARQFYPGKLTPDEAETVAVSAERVLAGIDAEMTPGGEIAGTVTEAPSGAALAKGQVCALRATGAPGGVETVSCALVGAGGAYTIRGLPAGSYDVVFDVPGFVVEFFDDRALESEAEAVSVSAPGLTQGIDASIRPRAVAGAAPGAPAPATTTDAMIAAPSASAPGPAAAKKKQQRPKKASKRPARRATASRLVLASDEIAITRAGTALVRLACRGRLPCHDRITLGYEPRTGGTSANDAIAPSALASLAGGRQGTLALKLDERGRALVRAGHGQLAVRVVIETL